jgi:hypothetical protein
VERAGAKRRPAAGRPCRTTLLAMALGSVLAFQVFELAPLFQPEKKANEQCKPYGRKEYKECHPTELHEPVSSVGLPTAADARSTRTC